VYLENVENKPGRGANFIARRGPKIV